MGETVWDGFGWVAADGSKVLEWEYVGAGVTGPMLRSEAAKWGSRPSRSMAVVLVLVSYMFFFILLLFCFARFFLGHRDARWDITYH